MSEKKSLKQLLDDLIECVGNDLLVLGATPDGRPHDPDPEIDRLKKEILRTYEGPGAVWVKATIEPPKSWRGYVKTRREDGVISGKIATWWPGWEIDNGYDDEIVIEYLDESRTAAGREEDAVEFAEWLIKNKYQWYAGGQWTLDDRHAGTTTQLYELFKQKEK